MVIFLRRRRRFYLQLARAIFLSTCGLKESLDSLIFVPLAWCNFYLFKILVQVLFMSLGRTFIIFFGMKLWFSSPSLLEFHLFNVISLFPKKINWVQTAKLDVVIWLYDENLQMRDSSKNLSGHETVQQELFPMGCLLLLDKLGYRVTNWAHFLYG